MNLIFAFGYREYEIHKCSNTYRIFIKITICTTIIFALLAYFLPFKEFYSFLENLSLFGSLIHTDLPKLNSTVIFKINFYGFIFVSSPLIILNFQSATKTMLGYQMKRFISTYTFQVAYIGLPFVLFLFIVFQILYLTGYILRSETELEMFNSHRRGLSLEASEYLIIVTTICLCYFRALRQYYYNELVRKY